SSTLMVRSLTDRIDHMIKDLTRRGREEKNEDRLRSPGPHHLNSSSFLKTPLSSPPSGHKSNSFLKGESAFQMSGSGIDNSNEGQGDGLEP
ncbi:unnamed protein product, partial [Symbiodinium necroappetens]